VVRGHLVKYVLGRDRGGVRGVSQPILIRKTKFQQTLANLYIVLCWYLKKCDTRLGSGLVVHVFFAVYLDASGRTGVIW